ncbi:MULTISPECIES: GLPGLI family protein [unclassified Carboxylicivirga]|uniref:GLPGLI family protein n=1 Tax=Carboxylicivirga TaxID=1628153 RepID=UPI003D32E2B6
MKSLFTSLIILLPLLLNAQHKELKICYDYINHAKPNTYDMELIANNKQVLSYTIRLTKSGSARNIRYKATTDSTLLFKDYNKGTMVYDESLGRDIYIIEEGLDLFNWHTTEECDTLLDYPCKTAFAEFRGREYKAYYTTDLPFTAAPWKFHGLPGVILKVASVDDVLLYQAKSLEIYETEKALYNPFEHNEAGSYNAFCKDYKAYRKEVIKIRNKRAKQQNRPAPKNNKAPRVEVIIPENRFILN